MAGGGCGLVAGLFMVFLDGLGFQCLIWWWVIVVGDDCGFGYFGV